MKKALIAMSGGVDSSLAATVKGSASPACGALDSVRRIGCVAVKGAVAPEIIT